MHVIALTKARRPDVVAEELVPLALDVSRVRPPVDAALHVASPAA